MENHRQPALALHAWLASMAHQGRNTVATRDDKLVPAPGLQSDGGIKNQVTPSVDRRAVFDRRAVVTQAAVRPVLVHSDNGRVPPPLQLLSFSDSQPFQQQPLAGRHIYRIRLATIEPPICSWRRPKSARGSRYLCDACIARPNFAALAARSFRGAAECRRALLGDLACNRHCCPTTSRSRACAWRSRAWRASL